MKVAQGNYGLQAVPAAWIIFKIFLVYFAGESRGRSIVSINLY